MPSALSYPMSGTTTRLALFLIIRNVVTVPIGHSLLESTSYRFYFKSPKVAKQNIKATCKLRSKENYVYLALFDAKYYLTHSQPGLEPYNFISQSIMLASQLDLLLISSIRKNNNNNNLFYDLGIGPNCLGICICVKGVDTQLQNQPGF